MTKNTSSFYKKTFKKRGFVSRRRSWRVAADFPSSFRYAFQGLLYAFISQRNFRIHLCIGFFTFGLGLWLNLKSVDLAILVLTISAVLVLELLNTAIEAVVDLSTGRRFHPLAKIAKDCSAASVLLASISSIFIAILLLVPQLLPLLGF
tara:strand:- start:193 stop:639 length:447 start_codon:yes stop_codon:yes gene_type:complete